MAETIHQRIKRLLAERKLKQNWVAKQLEVTPQAVQGWTKKITPDPKNLSGLADLLNVSVDELLGKGNGPGSEPRHSIIGIDTYSGNPIPIMVLGEISVSNMLEATAKVGNDTNGFRVPYPVDPGSIGFSMQDASMEPKISKGDIVIISPKRNVEPEKLVAVHIKSMKINVFRKFIFDGADHCALVPLSPGHRTFKFTHAEWAANVEVLGIYSGHFHRDE